VGKTLMTLVALLTGCSYGLGFWKVWDPQLWIGGSDERPRSLDLGYRCVWANPYGSFPDSSLGFLGVWVSWQEAWQIAFGKWWCLSEVH